MICFGDDATACQFASVGEFLDASGKMGPVEVHRCSRCGHGISLPPLGNVSFLYDSRESQDFQPASKGLSHLVKNFAFRRQAKKLLRQIGKPKEGILDFGCGSGQFTRVLGEVAGTDVVGADMHPDAPPELDAARYLPPVELDGRRGTFGVVMAMHVLEHDDDADALLNEIASYARPGGKLVIEVPNVDCVWAHKFGKYWDAWYLPYHRQHFTRRSLVRLMERNGLRIDSVYAAAVPTMGRTFANICGSSNNLFWLLAGIVAHPVQLAGELVTQQPSAFRVIATRTN